MARWDVEETRQQINHRFGAAQLNLAKQCMNAVFDRQRHARFHFTEARRLLKEHIDDRLPQKSILEITWPSNTEQYAHFDRGMTQMEAHVIACAQAIHSTGDGMAHVAYFALGLNLTPYCLSLRNTDRKKVARLIHDCFPAARPVAEKLDLPNECQEFKVLVEIVNGVKHRGLKPLQFNIDAQRSESSKPYDVEFRAIEVDGWPSPDVEIEKVLAPAYAASAQMIVGVGVAINAIHRRQ